MKEKYKGYIIDYEYTPSFGWIHRIYTPNNEEVSSCLWFLSKEDHRDLSKEDHRDLSKEDHRDLARHAINSRIQYLQKKMKFIK